MTLHLQRQAIWKHTLGKRQSNEIAKQIKKTKSEILNPKIKIPKAKYKIQFEIQTAQSDFLVISCVLFSQISEQSSECPFRCFAIWSGPSCQSQEMKKVKKSAIRFLLCKGNIQKWKGKGAKKKGKKT